MIAPVNVGSQAGGFDGHGNNAVMNQLIRDETIPKFSGQGGDFDDWQWRFQRHINTLEAAHGKPLPDKIKLVILERALPDCDRRWLVVLERQGELVTYQTVMAKLRAKAEPTKETQARQKWDALSFKTNGKITGHELYRFEVDFREAQQGVPSLSEEESYRHLLGRLPQHLSGWVIDEESRLRCTQPQLKFELPVEFTEVSVSDFVRAALKTNPVSVVTVSPGIFKVTFLNWMVAKKALEFDGRKIAGQQNEAKVSEIQPKMTVDQAFEMLGRRLEGRERGDNYLRQSAPHRDRFRSPRNDPRYVREAEASDSPRSPRRTRSPGRQSPRGQKKEKTPSSPISDGRSATPTSQPASETKSWDSRGGKGRGRGKGKGGGIPPPEIGTLKTVTGTKNGMDVPPGGFQPRKMGPFL